MISSSLQQQQLKTFIQPETTIIREMRKWNSDFKEAFTMHSKPKRNCFHPPSTAIPSHFPRMSRNSSRNQNGSSTNLLLFWLGILLVCFSPKQAVNGLPLVMTDTSLYQGKDGILSLPFLLQGESLLPQRQQLHWQIFQSRSKRIEDDEDNVTVQETTGLYNPGNNERVTKVLTGPRRKKGLSYLTKYYTESFLNSMPSSSGGGGNANSSAQSHQDSNNHFFGVSNGGGTSSTSQEHWFPSSARRKLSLYPPITVSSGFMSPWGRLADSGGRSSAMRLRWGK